MKNFFLTIKQFFKTSQYLIAALFFGLIVSLFFSRFLSLNILPLGLKYNHGWNWPEHTAFLTEPIILLLAIFGAAIMAILAFIFDRLTKFWFILLILIALVSLSLVWFFFQKSYMEYQLSLIGNAGFASFALDVFDNHSFFESLRNFNHWLIEDLIQIKGDKMSLHVQTHPIGSWLIFWFLIALTKVQSFVLLGYYKVIFNLILGLIPLILLVKKFGFRTITIFTLLIFLSPGFLFFATDPATTTSILMIWLICACLFLNNRPYWGIILGLTLFLLAIISFGNLISLIFAVALITTRVKIKNSLYLAFFAFILPFLFLRFLGYDYILGYNLAMIEHYSLMNVRNFDHWFLLNIYDLFLFAGIGAITVVFNLLINSFYFKDQRKEEKTANLIFFSGLLVILIIDLSGGVRGETGRILNFTLIPLFFYLAIKLNALIKNQASFVLVVFFISLLQLHAFLSLANVIWPVTGPVNLERETRMIYRDLGLPGVKP